MRDISAYILLIPHHQVSVILRWVDAVRLAIIALLVRRKKSLAKTLRGVSLLNLSNRVILTNHLTDATFLLMIVILTHLVFRRPTACLPLVTNESLLGTREVYLVVHVRFIPDENSTLSVMTNLSF